MNVSVVIPCYNGRRFIRQTIRSVVEQSVLPLEIIVVDDGSTDDSADIAKETSSLVRVISQTNQGESTARNHGVAAAAGDWIAFLDADDVWEKTRIEEHLRLVEQHPRAIATHCNLYFFGAGEGQTSIENHDPSHRYSVAELCKSNVFHSPSAVFVKRSVCPSFPTHVQHGEDAYFFFDLVQLGEIAFTPKPLVGYRKHDSNQSAKLSTRIGWLQTRETWYREHPGLLSVEEFVAIQDHWLSFYCRLLSQLVSQRNWRDHDELTRFLEEYPDHREVSAALAKPVYPKGVYWLKDRIDSVPGVKGLLKRFRRSIRRGGA